MPPVLDWAAPIMPGKSMIGLELGMSHGKVVAILRAYRCSLFKPDLIRFANSPVLRIDLSESSCITLRAAEIKSKHYPWQDVVANLIFHNAKLSAVSVRPAGIRPDIHYKGRLLERFGLGSPIFELAQHCKLHYDEPGELFYARRKCSGLAVGGGSCDLFDDPDQCIGYIRIYRDARDAMPPWTYGGFAEHLRQTVSSERQSENCSMLHAYAIVWEEVEDGLHSLAQEMPLALVALAIGAREDDVLERLLADPGFRAALCRAAASDTVAGLAAALPFEDGQVFTADATAMRQALDEIPSQPTSTIGKWTYADYEAMIEVETDWAMEGHDSDPLDLAVRRAYDRLSQQLKAKPDEEPMALLAVANYVLGKGAFSRFVRSKGWGPGFRMAVAPEVVSRVLLDLPHEEHARYLAHVEAIQQAYAGWQ